MDGWNIYTNALNKIFRVYTYLEPRDYITVSLSMMAEVEESSSDQTVRGKAELSGIYVHFTLDELLG